MKKIFFIGLLNLIVFTILFVSCSPVNEKPKTTPIIYTTLDVKQNYEILQVITGFAEIIITAPSTKESFLKAYSTAWANLATEANKLKANAVVGIHVEFINGSDNLRIVAYGTAVKYK